MPLPMPWKVLICSLVAFVAALTWAFARMAEYLQWLHFNTTELPNEGLMSTAPGTEVTIALWVVGLAAVGATIAAFVVEGRKPGGGDIGSR